MWCHLDAVRASLGENEEVSTPAVLLPNEGQRISPALHHAIYNAV